MNCNSQNKNFSLSITKYLIFLSAFFLFNSCKTKKESLISIDPAYSQFIDSYTSGVISKTGSIKITLASNIATTHAIGEVKDKKYFTFSPSVKGKTIWLDANTIEFQPETNLESDKLYKASFDLGNVTNVPKKYDEFSFNFQTIKPSFQVTSYGLRSSGDKDKMFINGVVETADFEKSDVVEKVLFANANNSPLKIIWEHNDNSKIHAFKVEGILRTQTEKQFNLSWNGKSANMDVKGMKEMGIPAIGDFKVLNVMPMNETEQYASIQFSDPIAVGQELTGLIALSDQQDITYSINGSEVKLYTGDKLDGSYTININPGIKNTFGKSLDKGYTSNVFFENRLPSVKIQGRGNILPNAGRLVLPFESVNLNAVDISIIKIYENNIPQFFQTNNIAGESDLRRVGKPIVQKTLRLDDDKTLDLNKKQRFTLDIDKFLKTEPGAIYRITIGFRPEYSLYNCENKKSNDGEESSDSEMYDEADDRYSLDEDDAFWSRYGNYYYYGYDWQNRNNPCTKSYYNKDRWASRNIVASNIGLTAKMGTDNTVRVAVANILTAEPMIGVELEMLDYQNQIIQKSSSDRDGFAIFELTRKPYLLIAKNKEERGYLKIDDGSSLPLSRFEITGEEIKKGIKGFIFGERGVWRPGDTLFINCIIESKESNLPEGFPLEFELYTPQGQLFQRIVQNNAAGGYNVFKALTQQSSPTGNWVAKIKAGGAVFEKRIKIETVMPNRLKIDVNFGADSILGLGGNNTGQLESKWLFGSPAKSLKAKIDASLYPKKNPFPKFKGFNFTNPTINYYTQSKTIFDGRLSEEGTATINPNFEADESAPGMLSANLVVKVFEPGGAFSTSSLSFPYSPFTSYAGIKIPEGDKLWGFLESGKPHTAEIVDVDNKGNLISGNKEVEVQFYKIQWRWWWDDSGESFSNFTQDKYNKLISKQNVELKNGKGTYNFKVGENEWGRFLILVKDIKSGHIAGEIVYLDQPGWQSRNNMDDPTAASMLSFTSDKEKYNVGDDITLTIPSSEGGRGLISIENGSKVIQSFWVQTKKGQTTVKFKAEKEMSPNVYATVSLIQPHSQTINDLPIRMYGTIPIIIEDKNTILNPVINMAAVIRPEQSTNITVSEKDGKEMYYSIAIVDEGLLDLTHFKTPQPHDYFYSKEALGVKTWDLYDWVIGAWGSNLERILTIGGDEDAGSSGKQKQANRFKAVVKYMGPFKLKKGQKATHQFMLPQYIGAVRAMVVAANEGSYGSADKSIQVKKPLMILGTAPRVLGPGEIVKIPVTVFALEPNIKMVNVSLQTNKFLQVVGNSTQQVSFNSIGEQMIYFDVKVKSETGIGKLKITSSSGNEKADYDVELNIRNPNPPVTNVVSKNLNGGESWTELTSAIGSVTTAKAVLELSSIPALNLEKRLDFLINYPHGCIEQITSGAFPQLYLKDLTSLSEFKEASVQKNVKGVISAIQNYQTNEGGFSYWPGEGKSDEWGTNYAGHFLLEAQNKGFIVSSQLLQQWKSYQGKMARSWAPSTTNFYGADLTQSYRLYLLALAKIPELGAMNRLKEF
ncbi:MAG: MG2 domain-containing protein, partial [Ferruginibacter sp.]